MNPFRLPARKTFHGYAAATRYRPEWTTFFLVFQAGLPRTKHASITGGGQIYGHEFGAFGPNILAANSPGMPSLTGGGQMPSDTAIITGLVGGLAGPGS